MDQCVFFSRIKKETSNQEMQDRLDVFPNYSCNKQKVLNKKSPLTEVFIQFLYGKWHNYMEEKEYMYTDIMGQTLHYMITQWQ